MSEQPGRLRVVFDCNTCVQAIAFEKGPAGAAFTLFEAGVFELFVSRDTLNELERVLNYSEVRAIDPNITDVRVAAFTRRLTYRATRMRRVPPIFDFRRDPGDAPYLDLAAAVGADFLVTRDKDLLSLMAEHSAFARRFRQITRPLRIVDPNLFLAEIGDLRGRE